MEPNKLNEIDFDGICTYMNRELKIGFERIAYACGNIDVQTLYRWRKKKPTYKLLKTNNYKPIFDLLEETVGSENDYINLLKNWYPKLKHCKDNEHVKKVVINSLNYHLDPTDINTISAPIIHAKDFIHDCRNNGKEIDSIYMAFHSGWDWLKELEKRQLLETLCNDTIKLQIIVNDHAVIRKIAKTMSDPKMEKHYLGFNEGIEQWHKLSTNMESLDVRISDYPIFRKLYLINYKDGTSEARIRDYVYDYATEFDNINIYLTNEDPALNIFEQEFKFLWDKSKSYFEWLDNLPKAEELIPSGKYAIIYLSQTTDLEILELTISDNNVAQLVINTDSITYDESENSYRGSIKMAQKNIFITLLDKYESEQQTLSLIRPRHNMNRYIGIMTALNPQDQPVSFKCACIDQKVLNNIDLQKLKKILSINNNELADYIVIDEQAVALFYSEKIYRKK